MKYVLLFPFIRNGSVVLKRMSKEHPITGLRGKWNGYGGKVEAGELPVDAAEREGDEELLYGRIPWTCCGRFSGPGWEVWCFYARVSPDAPRPDGHSVMDVRHVQNNCVVPNLNWLLPLADAVMQGHALQFEIVETR